MRQQSYKLLVTLLAIALSLAVLVMAGQSLFRLDERSRSSARQVALDAIERAVMQCYALEGAYPPDLFYLADNYGLILDEQHFVYQYEVVAANIHPIIGVQYPGENES
jgi:hypothetical protein